MPTIKLSQLPSASTPHGTDILPMVQNNTTVGVAVEQLRRSVNGTVGVNSGDAPDMKFYTGGGAAEYGSGGNFNVFLGDGHNAESGYGGEGGNFNFYGGESHSNNQRGGYFWVGSGDNLGYYGTGGYVSLNAGDAPYGYGGDVEIDAGDGFFYGGSVEINAGDGYSYFGSGEGGNVYINAGSGNYEGGNVVIGSGRANTENSESSGGEITIYASPGHIGGRVYIKAGRGYAGNGGHLYLYGGNNRGEENGGHVHVKGGYTYTGTAGSVFIEPGHPTSEGSSGQIYLRSLPTTDPGKYGSIWCDVENSNIIKVSTASP